MRISIPVQRKKRKLSSRARTVKMASDAFQVDVILSSIKELQEEKVQNERVLADLYKQRRQWEAKLEEASSKHAAVREEDLKKKESLKVAEQKVTQSENLVRMMEKVNDGKRKKISDLNHKIANTQRMSQQQLYDFERKMVDLTDKFRNAHQFYLEDNLEREMTELDKKKAELLEEIEQSKRREAELVIKIEQAKMEREKRERETIPQETMEMVVEMFLGENKASQMALDRSRAKLNPLLEERERLTQQLAELESNISQTHKSEE